MEMEMEEFNMIQKIERRFAQNKKKIQKIEYFILKMQKELFYDSYSESDSNSYSMPSF